MGIAKYEIFGTEGVWRIRHDGKAENEYATKEAAFEAAHEATLDAEIAFLGRHVVAAAVATAPDAPSLALS